MIDEPQEVVVVDEQRGQVNLALGDEFLIGPATSAATVEYTIKSTSELSVETRDGIARRDALITSLMARVQEQEAQLVGRAMDDARRLAEALFDALAARLGFSRGRSPV